MMALLIRSQSQSRSCSPMVSSAICGQFPRPLRPRGRSPDPEVRRDGKTLAVPGGPVLLAVLAGRRLSQRLSI